MIEFIVMTIVGVWLYRLGRDIKNTLADPPPDTARQRRRDTIVKIGRN